MRASRPLRSAVASLGLAVACAHGEAAPATSAPGVRWPEPPLAPRVRLSAIVDGGAVARPWWRTALGVLVGEPAAAAERLTLVRPFDVAQGSSGTLWVADPDGRRVVGFDPRGKLAGEASCPGHPWNSPMSIVAEGDGSVLVADAGAGAIVRWTPAGCHVVRGDGLQRPTGIAVAGGRIFVADPPAHQIVVLDADGSEISRWGGRGDGEGRFQFPTDVAVSAGTVLVVDSLNFRIARLSASGEWLGSLGAPGEDGAGFVRPKGIVADGGGRVYVSDAQRDVVLVFEPDGSLGFLLGAPGSGPGRLAHPAGLSVDGPRIAVADSLNQRVQVFERVGGSP